MPTSASSQPSTSALELIFPQTLRESLFSPMGWALLAVIGLSVFARLAAGKRKGILARGHLAGPKHKAAARKEACKLIEKRKHNEVALYVGSPKGSVIRKEGNKYIRYLPEDPNTLYIPNAEAGIAAIGATGCGKSYSLINPLIRSALDQGFPVIYFDFKYTSDSPNPTSQIAGYAQERGYQTSVFAPGLPESCICNPVAFLRSPGDAETARQLALVIHRNFTPSSANESNPFFTQTAQKMIQGLFMLAKYSKYPDLMMMRAIARSPNLTDLIENSDLPETIKLVFDSLVASAGAPETLSGIQATVANMLGNLMSPGLLPAFCGQTNMPLDLDRRQLLVFGVDGERKDVVLPMLASIINVVVNRNVMRPRKTPLILCLDEIPAIYLPSLDDWLNQNRSAGLCTLLGFQSMDMLEKLYSKTGAGRIVGGCTTQAVFQLNDLETARMYSELPGNEDVDYKQKSRSFGKSRGHSLADHRQTRKVLEPNEIITFPRGKCLLFNRGYGNRKEVRVPLLQQIVIPKRDIESVKASVQRWPAIKEQLAKQSNLRLPTDQEMIERRSEVLQILLSEEDKARREAQLAQDREEFANIEREIDFDSDFQLPKEITERSFAHATASNPF